MYSTGYSYKSFSILRCTGIDLHTLATDAQQRRFSFFVVAQIMALLPDRAFDVRRRSGRTRYAACGIGNAAPCRHLRSVFRAQAPLDHIQMYLSEMAFTACR